MLWVKRLILMIQFLTRIPIPISISASNEEISWGTIFFPIVGLIVGLFMVLGYYLGTLTKLSILPAILAVVFQIIITGFFHIDGLGDTFDGLFCNKDRDGILNVMRDSRTGTGGVIAIITDILIKTLLLAEIASQYGGWYKIAFIIAMPMIGRMGMLTAAGLSTYARSEGGLGKAFVDGVGTVQWGIGLAVGTVVLIFFFGANAIIHVGISIITAFVFTKYIESKIQGMTGDTLGAANEVCELFYLIFFILIQSL
jgi:adenosylcobinamide-GDP ribazoletransferase